jgi:uncharacterized protein YjcR
MQEKKQPEYSPQEVIRQYNALAPEDKIRANLIASINILESNMSFYERSPNKWYTSEGREKHKAKISELKHQLAAQSQLKISIQ